MRKVEVILMPDYQVVLNVVSLVVGVASAVLAVIAIWLALHSKGEADRVNNLTRDLLTEIKSDAKTVAQVALPELRAYGDSMRRFVLQGSPDDRRGSDEKFDKIERTLERVEQQLGGVKTDADPAGVTRELNDALRQLKQSNAAINREVIQKRFNGVGIILENSSVVSTSSPKETLQDLLNFVFPRAVAGKKLLRENYGTDWTLISARTGNALPLSAVRDTKATFESIGLRGGDRLELKTITNEGKV
jgi:hypothetical protein